jgi:predicted nucleotidyltransferase
MARIRAFAQQIVRRFDPVRVILFGSHARGTAAADSDVDLLVVLQGSPRNDKAARMRMALEHPFAMDLLVIGESRLQQRLRMGDSFLAEIVREGIVLYECADARVAAKG